MFASAVISLISCQLWVTHTFASELVSPQAIKVYDGDTLHIKTIFMNNHIYDPDEEDQLMIEMTSRAFCVNDICSIPGPTLIVYPGTTFHIEFANQFEVTELDLSDADQPDATGLHSHGLHISGAQDNVFETVLPTQSSTITWTIHDSHHLGSNWYHVHHHKTTALQVKGGVYGALIVDSYENKELDYNEPSTINDYVLQISWQYLHDNDRYCHNCVYSETDKERFAYTDSFKKVHSLCVMWCGDFSDTQRMNSAYEYDVKLADGVENNQDKLETDENGISDFPAFEGYLVNNLYQPTISQSSKQYFKLRIIATSAEIYTQLQFDSNSQTQCEYLMIARDGIALKDKSRDLTQEPYFGFFLLPPGGRIDVKVYCRGEGTAVIMHNEVHPHYAGVNESYPMGRIDEQILFKLSITRQGKNKGAKHHLDYPEPVTGFPYYLTELLSESTETGDYSECPCSNYDRENTEDTLVKESNYCAVEFIEGEYDSAGNLVYDLFEVNGVTFDGTNAIFIIEKNKVYEFYVNSDGHPFHFHVNPFMVTEDLLNGYVAEEGDWMDTLGFKNEAGTGIKIKYNTADFDGNVIFHCHFLGHEDLGMMAFVKIVDGVTADLEQCERDYGFQNDYLTETKAIEKPLNVYYSGGNTKGEVERGGGVNYNVISGVLFIMIFLTFILNCFVRCVNARRCQQNC